MRTGRYILASIVVFLVRMLLHFAFYGVLMVEESNELAQKYPGLMRNATAGFILGDLVFAFIFVCLFIRVAEALGGGIKGGLVLALYVWGFSSVVVGIYQYSAFTFFTPGSFGLELGAQLVFLLIQGAVAAKLYPVPATSSEQAQVASGG